MDHMMSSPRKRWVHISVHSSSVLHSLSLR
jgi:hypothetical protein